MISLTATNVPSSTPTPFGGGTGKIAFTAVNQENEHSIYTMNIDGSNLTRLTDIGIINCFNWSSDGQNIVFESNFDIYVTNVAGKSQPKLIVDVTPWHGDAGINCPTWSPNGQQLLVSSAFLPAGVHTVGLDGSGLTELTNIAGWGHAWSFDGQHIVFTSSHDSLKPEIYIVNVDGSNLIRLTNNNARDWDPAWSPNGRTIAFVSDRKVEDIYEIYSMNADGSDQRKLTQTSGRYTGKPTWSPDGRYITYVSQHLDDNQWNWWIYITNADGMGPRQLIKGENPAWSPDSQYLVFTDEHFNMYMLAVECVSLPEGCGAHVTRLLIPSTFTSIGFPAWQPSSPPIP